MEWWLALLTIFGSLLVLMMTGLHFATCFMIVCIFGGIFLMGGLDGIGVVTQSLYKSVASFTLLPLPLFILMGEIMYGSGLAPEMMKALDVWLGRIPGRLSLLAVGAGTVLSFLTGVSMASVAMLGSTLVPEMEKQGYQKSMSLGSILGSGSLAVMIPPSTLAILLGAIGEIPVAKLLIAIIFPGLLLAVIFAAYIIIRCMAQPSLAPPYDSPPTPLGKKIKLTLINIAPLSIIIFLVTGVILLGVATPTEAAATGALGTVLLIAAYKRLTWKMLRSALTRTVSVTVMIMIVVMGAGAFGQITSFSGASAGLASWVASLEVSPVLSVIFMLVAALFLGMFVSTSAVIMTLIPLFMPTINAMGIDPIWFGVLFIIATETGLISPPYGACLFVMKGVATKDTTIGDCYRASLPYCYLNIFAMAVIIVFPTIATWPPGIMK